MMVCMLNHISIVLPLHLRYVLHHVRYSLRLLAALTAPLALPRILHLYRLPHESAAQ